MSVQTANISEEDVENRPPSTLLYSNGPFLANTNSTNEKRNDYLKQRSRRKRWWYFNRGLQPIYEAGESKDDPPTSGCSTLASEDNRSDEYLNIKNSNFSTDETPSENIIPTSSNQIKESYSPCMRVIEKFQEIVMDSAVRVIQAAFKRFRERRRFLRIKKAVMVIQRNLRKWIQARQCLRPAGVDRQCSESEKSEEYREVFKEDNDEEKVSNDKEIVKLEDGSNLSEIQFHEPTLSYSDDLTGCKWKNEQSKDLFMQRDENIETINNHVTCKKDNSQICKNDKINITNNGSSGDDTQIGLKDYFMETCTNENEKCVEVIKNESIGKTDIENAITYKNDNADYPSMLTEEISKEHNTEYKEVLENNSSCPFNTNDVSHFNTVCTCGPAIEKSDMPSKKTAKEVCSRSVDEKEMMPEHCEHKELNQQISQSCEYVNKCNGNMKMDIDNLHTEHSTVNSDSCEQDTSRTQQNNTKINTIDGGSESIGCRMVECEKDNAELIEEAVVLTDIAECTFCTYSEDAASAICA